MNNSLQARYTVIFLGWILLVVTVVSSALFLVHYRSAGELRQEATDFVTSALERQVARQGLEMAQALASSVVNGLYHFDIKAVRDLASTALQQSSVLYVYVYDDKGTVVNDGTEFGDSYGIQLEDSQSQHTLTSGSMSLSRQGATIHLSVPITLGNRIIGGVRMGLSLASISDNVRKEIRTLYAITNRALFRHVVITTIVAVALCLVGVILGTLVARNLSRPIRTLSALTKCIARGDYNIKPLRSRNDEIGELSAAFQNMAEQLKRTTVSKVYFDNILQSMNEMLFVTNVDGCIETVNRSAFKELGYREEELLGKSLIALLSEQSGPRPTATPFLNVKDGAAETRLLTKSGEKLPIYWSGSELQGTAADHRRIVYVGRNISDLKQVELELRLSLKEKQILLKEIHHRVKNNLQLISSLLSLQAQQIDDSSMNYLFRESENRIHSIALIHEQLYRSQSLAKIYLPEYIHGLIDHVTASFGKNSKNIFFHLDITEVYLSVDTAIPCGLLTNELISNAIQHAFIGRRSGDIWVSFKSRNGQHCLKVRDNGIGLPQVCAKAKSTTLGLQLIHGLAKQLSATLSTTVQEGTSFTITFQDTAPN